MLGQAVAKYLTEGELDVSNINCDLSLKIFDLKLFVLIANTNTKPTGKNYFK